VGGLGEAIDHLRAADALCAAPCVEVALGLEIDAVLLDAHVAHVELLGELADGEALGALELVNDLQPLALPDLGD
jgi:hypothetical protein